MTWPSEDDMAAEAEAARQQAAFVKGAAKGVYEGGKSMAEGVWELAKGGYKLATDPEARQKAWETTQALAGMAKDYAGQVRDDPAKAWRDAKNGANALYSEYEKARQAAEAEGKLAEFYGKVVGRGAFEAAALLVPVSKLAEAGKLGEASKLGKLAEAANSAGKVEEAGAAARAARAVSNPAMGVIDSGVEVLPCGRVVSKARTQAGVISDAVKAQRFDNLVTFGSKANPLDTDVGRKMIAELEAQGMSSDKALAKVIELFESGKNIPVETFVAKGEKLYKLSPGGASPVTPYWMTKADLDKLAGLSIEEMANKLGLPVGSIPKNGEGFILEEIEALEDLSIYQSEIAPLKQQGYDAIGGARQSLVTARNKFSQAAPPKMPSPPQMPKGL